MQSLAKAINNHLSCEFQASHTYLAMSIWLREKDLAGFSTYMQSKSQEERGHADRLIGYPHLSTTDMAISSASSSLLIVLISFFFLNTCLFSSIEKFIALSFERPKPIALQNFFVYDLETFLIKTELLLADADKTSV